MTTEIELKYLVMDDNLAEVTAGKITELLIDKDFTFVPDSTQLTNHYFDTPSLDLRLHDMGLRVRRSVSENKPLSIEQTIKTAGKVVGGLHQRPEYNVAIEHNFPALPLFPNHIWHDEQNISAIQSQLQTIFTTDFTRMIWTVTVIDEQGQNNIVELVLDQGLIQANDRAEKIYEIELELVTGQVEAVLILAEALSECLFLRAGQKSKAARGYHLWQNLTDDLPSVDKALVSSTRLFALELVPLHTSFDVNHSLITGINFALNKLQEIVSSYVAQPSVLYLNKVTELLALLRHGFWLFEPYLPENIKQIREELSYFIKELHWVDDACHLSELMTKTGNYRNKLHYSERLITQLNLENDSFPTSQSVCDLLHSKRFNCLQLALLKILLGNQVLDQNSSVAPIALLPFAQTALESSLQNLVTVMPKNKQLTSEQYLDQYKLLIRCLLTGSWFGGLYEKSERLGFRNPWLDIKQGISELQTILLLQQQLALLNEPSVKLANWLETKAEHLLLTLEHSREKALSTVPYWRQ